MLIFKKTVVFRHIADKQGFDMREMADVDTGKVVVRRGRWILKASAIGSCVAVAAYDAVTKTAGMAHVMLPGRCPEFVSGTLRYAANAIENLLEQMLAYGAKLADIEVCLVGAGNVLQRDDDTICAGNIESVMAILAELNVSVKASLLGGTKRKSALLDAETGRISCTQGDGPVQMLWQFGQGG